MIGVTDSQIEEARAWDLESYLRVYEPEELKRSGLNQYRMASHGSLVISNGKWHWFSRGIGGKGALDFLIKVKGMDFLSAVRMLSDGNGIVPPVQKQQEKPNKSVWSFELPKASPYAVYVTKYLMGRGIDIEIIQQCIDNGSLYESLPHHNCVFVGRDKNGEARFAAMRGIHDDFKIDVKGSDKRWGFCLPALATDFNSSTIAVFESAVDALSGATIKKRSGQNWKNFYYLALGGTSPLALIQFIRDHKEINGIALCLDNDAAGRRGTEKIIARIRADTMLQKRNIRLLDMPPPEKYGKDYNDCLKGMAADKQWKENQSIQIQR